MNELKETPGTRPVLAARDDDAARQPSVVINFLAALACGIVCGFLPYSDGGIFDETWIFVTPLAFLISIATYPFTYWGIRGFGASVVFSLIATPFLGAMIFMLGLRVAALIS